MSMNTKLKLLADGTSIQENVEIREEATRRGFHIRYLVKALIKYNASDMHLRVGRPPLYRISGKMIPAKMEEMTQKDLEFLLDEVLNQRLKNELEAKKQVDFSFSIKDYGRFRCNVFNQKGTLAAAVRMIPFAVPDINALGLPDIVKELCMRQKGLILVTGATGMGKSTSLAAMIQYMNENRYAHILDIENPIEFTYQDVRSTITQREVGTDVLCVQDALIAGLRQDPDIIVIGELRDKEMIQAAITAAETGHLVLATLHTNDAKSTIDRILDVFPAEQQNQIRLQLASSLLAVMSQRLMARADQQGRILACEVMIKSPLIESHLLKNERHRIPDAIENSSDYYKMQSLNQHLERLVRLGRVTMEEAKKVSPNPEELEMIIAGISRKEGY